jgi:DNA-binding CsgD family transcriptional regulator
MPAGREDRFSALGVNARDDLDPPEAGSDPLSVIALRSHPRMILLDPSLRISFVDWSTMLTLLRYCDDPTKPMEYLPERLAAPVREAVAHWQDGEAGDVIVEPLPDIILRITPITGVGGTYVALFVEERARRDDVREAIRRFLLSRREAQVLTLVLQGRSGAEIASELGIAQSTVGDHVKSLMRKTAAKNRTDMIARVLGWMDRNQTA